MLASPVFSALIRTYLEYWVQFWKDLEENSSSPDQIDEASRNHVKWKWLKGLDNLDFTLCKFNFAEQVLVGSVIELHQVLSDGTFLLAEILNVLEPFPKGAHSLVVLW